MCACGCLRLLSKNRRCDIQTDQIPSRNRVEHGNTRRSKQSMRLSKAIYLLNEPEYFEDLLRKVTSDVQVYTRQWITVRT